MYWSSFHPANQDQTIYIELGGVCLHVYMYAHVHVCVRPLWYMRVSVCVRVVNGHGKRFWGEEELYGVCERTRPESSKKRPLSLPISLTLIQFCPPHSRHLSLSKYSNHGYFYLYSNMHVLTTNTHTHRHTGDVHVVRGSHKTGQSSLTSCQCWPQKGHQKGRISLKRWKCMYAPKQTNHLKSCERGGERDTHWTAAQARLQAATVELLLKCLPFTWNFKLLVQKFSYFLQWL